MNRGAMRIKAAAGTLAALLAGLLAACQTPGRGSIGPAEGRTLTVIGEGVVRTAPDTATARLGVEILSATLERAQEESRRRMNAVMEALAAAGIDPKDIQTSYYNISFERQPPEPPPRPLPEPAPDSQPPAAAAPAGHYRVSNLAAVTVRRIDQVGRLIDAAVAAGANQIWGIEFTLWDPAPAEARARAEALRDARRKAQAMAELAGLRLGPVVTVSELAGGPGIEPRFAAAEALGGPTPISPGELVFRSQVQVVYRIQ